MLLEWLEDAFALKASHGSGVWEGSLDPLREWFGLQTRLRRDLERKSMVKRFEEEYSSSDTQLHTAWSRNGDERKPLCV